MSTASEHPATEWHLRVPAADELRAFATPAQLAFGGGFGDAELDDWLKLAEPERWLGAFESADSDLAAGCASAYSVRLTVPGGEVAAAAVTGVGVRPDHRRRGILRALMRRQLDDVRELGEPVAVLWASESAIYQRFGYGQGTLDGSFEVATSSTAYGRAWVPEGRVRVVSAEEAPPLVGAAYEAMRTSVPGALSRSDAWWTEGVLADPEYSRHGAGPKFCVIYEAEGRPEGYAIYRVKDDWDHRGPRGVLEVTEAVTNTPRALRGLWRFLFDVDLVRTVKARHLSVPDPLQYLLIEPRALGMVANDGLWVRLVDLPAALAARGYGSRGSLVLDVADEFCPWNTGRWRLEASGDQGAAQAEVSRTDASPDLVLDTADLAALYLGGTRPSDLAAAGRIEERTSGAVARAEALFIAERAPWCVMMF